MRDFAADLMLGATRYRQIKKCFNDGFDGRCAIGAVESISGLSSNEEAREFYPYLFAPCQGCPSCHYGRVESALLNVVMHLNDSHGWTFLEIAQWIYPIIQPYLEAEEELLEKPATLQAVAE